MFNSACINCWLLVENVLLPQLQILFYILLYVYALIGSREECKGYLCEDETCIDNIFLCDGHNDCPQNDDENNCTNVKNSHEIVECVHDFECLEDRTCLPMEFVCDGIKQCLDGSDETMGCLNIQTSCASGFLCKNGHCLLDLTWVCDGSNDCGDNSDEVANCSKSFILNIKKFKILLWSLVHSM